LDSSATIEEQLAVLNGLWNVEVHRAELGTTHELARQSLELAARHDDPHAAGSANSRIGITLCLMGMFVEARCHLERALGFYGASQQSAVGGSIRSGNALLLLGTTLWALGYPEQAVTAPARALADARESGHTVAIGIALFWTAFLEAAFGASLPSCASCPVEATADCAEHLKMYEPWARFNEGIITARRGDPQLGIELMEAAIATAKEFNAQLLRPVHLGHLANTRAVRGQPVVGLTLLDEAIRTVEETQERMFEAELHRLRGDLLMVLGKSAEAEESLHRALTVARRQQARMWELRAAKGLAALWRCQPTALPKDAISWPPSMAGLPNAHLQPISRRPRRCWTIKTVDSCSGCVSPLHRWAARRLRKL
jgi:tetratricopeptide (TPR) repeat protein